MLKRYIFNLWLLAFLLVFGAALGQIEPDPPLRLPGAVLRDSEDLLVGQLVSHDRVLMRDGSLPIILAFSVDRIRATTVVYYLNPDCEGPVFLVPAKAAGSIAPLIGYNYGIGKDSRLYRSREEADPHAIEVDSSWRPDTDACENFTQTISVLVPATKVVRLDDVFTPPFRID